MEYKIEKSGYNVKIDASLNAAEWEAEVDKAYQEKRGEFKLQGFRPGKAPRKMIEKMYGEGVFFETAIDNALQSAFEEVCDKEQIEPIARPDVDLGDLNENGITFTLRVIVRPEVKLGEYKGLTIERTIHTVKDEDVNERIESIRERHAKKVEVADREARLGDFANIDYSGSVDGVKFDGGTATGHELELGSGNFISGFEEQVVGMKVGEEKDINVTFPAEYHAENLAGKPAVFAIKLNAIKAKELPALDDDFAMSVSDFDNFEEYKSNLLDSMIKTAEQRTDVEAENKLLDTIANNTTIDIPDVMIEQQIDHFVEDFSYRLSQQGMKLEDYFKYTGSTLEQMRESRKKEAEHAVRIRLVIEEIILAEKITVTDADIDAELERLAEAAKKPVKEYKKLIGSRNIRYLANDILMKKVLEMLKESNTYVEAKAEAKAEAKKEKKETKKK